MAEQIEILVVDDGDGSYVDKLVKHTAQQFHLQYLAHQNPNTDEDKHSIEDVYGA